MSGILRLLHLRDQNDAKGEQMRHERARFEAIKEGGPTRAVSSFNLFQTPEHLADRMAHALGRRSRILEPSAGLGRLYRAVRLRTDSPLVMVEQSPDCCAELYRETDSDAGARLVQSDFLVCDADRLGGLFDGVIMNPPFKMGRDIKHIKRALSMLADGGRLVSLCYAGRRQREQLAPIGEWIDLPADTFKGEGTRAGAAMLVVNK